MYQTTHGDESSVDGLWVLLVSDDGQRVPMMARAGNQTYLLGFKNAPKARNFLEGASVQAEPRLVVPGNRMQVLRAARDGGAIGVLVDYDPSTQQYASAAELY